MTQHSASTVTQTTTDPLSERFGDAYRLPRGLREEAAGMSWSLFTATYCPAADVRVTHLDSERIRGGKNRYSAEVLTVSKTQAPRTDEREVVATGPVSACTHLLAASGRFVEILTFRQQRLFEATVTFIKVAPRAGQAHAQWAVGFGQTAEASVAAALSSGAQRLYG